MAKISETLQRLQEQQKQERENTQQLHEKNLQSLNKNLTELYENKLNTIKSDMQEMIKKSLKKELEEIDNTMWYYRQIIKWLLIALPIVLTIGGVTGFFMEKYLNRNKIYLPEGIGTQNESEIKIQWNDKMRWDDKTKTIIIKKGE